MLSRVADSIYWMNRYIERAENYARFIDVNYNLTLEQSPGMTEQWKALILATGDWGVFEKLHSTADKASAIHFLGFDENNPNSILNCITYARENARAVRPEITREVWEQINFLYHLIRTRVSRKSRISEDQREFFTEIKKGCQLLYGIYDSTISRNEGWHFGKIGQFLERADKTSRILDVKYHILLPTTAKVGSPFDIIQWAALLKSVSSYDMYRKLNGNLMPSKIVEFLLLNKEFPRSILHCLIRAEASIQKIADPASLKARQVEKVIGVIRSKLEYSDVNEIFEKGLHEFLDEIQLKIIELSNTISDAFFAIPKNDIIVHST
jgi:uncharacterized alpha-E superfamily protein